MGSSAALTAAFVGAVLRWFSPGDFSDIVSITHKIAQASHAAAQGKLGSGFDIASAVFGSGLYIRFTDEIIKSLLLKSDAGGLSSEVVEAVFQHAAWDHLHEHIALPPNFSLTLGKILK